MINHRDKVALEHRLRSEKMRTLIRSALIVGVALTVSIALAANQYADVQLIQDELSSITALLNSSQQVSNDHGVAPTSLTISGDNTSSAILSWFHDATVDANCRLTGLAPQELEAASALPYSSWTIDVSGSYHCIGRLTESLEQSSNIVEIVSINISTARNAQKLHGRIAVNVWVVE